MFSSNLPVVTCPPLLGDAVGSFYPDWCNNGTQPYATFCTLRCPSGYYINYLTVDVPTDSRACQSNGSWEYRDTTPACKGKHCKMIYTELNNIFLREFGLSLGRKKVPCLQQKNAERSHTSKIEYKTSQFIWLTGLMPC